MLRITVQDGPAQVRLKLEGSLTGIWVSEVEEAWRAAQETRAGRALCLDVTAVDRVDLAGQYLLALLHRSGVELLATGTMMPEVVQTIVRDWPRTEEQ
jgi:ABC-type transporter Mla MlaB component